MNRIKVFFLNFMLICFFSIQANAQFWNLVWSDEFSGSSINTADWNFEIGTGSSGWGNNEWQYYTARPQNASIVNGHLAIVAKKENYAGSNYTSARMTTQTKQSWKYGKIEARIKFPLRQGIWPAFWMLGDNFSTVGWPKCGEMDIMEHINTSDDIHGTIHWDANGYATYGGSSTIFNVGDFHTYAIEWDSTAIRWFVDGNQYHTANILNGINSTAEFHEPFFIILNMAVGGNWPGYPNVNDQINDTMLIDYVRVYKNGKAPTSINENENTLGQIFVHPNPIQAGNGVSIRLPKTGKYSIQVYNSVGYLCQEKKIYADVQKEISLSLDDYSPGVYFLKVINGNHKQTRKLLITP